MFFKLIKLLIIIAIIFLITMIILEYFIKTINQKELIRISAILTGIISIIFILSIEKIENFEEIEDAEEDAEEEIEEEEILKEDIKDDLQTLLDDMVDKVNENDVETEESEPQLSSDTSRTRTEISQEKSSISLDNEIAENQKKVEETALPMEIPSSTDAVISNKISQETQDKYTLMKIEDFETK